MQRQTSIEDQVAVARRYADTQGWELLEQHIYRDEAVSGASLERPGVRSLLAAAAQRPRPFDVLLVDDTSRVSRDTADAVRSFQQLTFYGIRVIYITQGIDSDHPQAEMQVTFHGMVDSLYRGEGGKKVRRGLAGQLGRGFATGSITFGYRTVPVPDPSGRTDPNGYPAVLGKRVEIEPAEARVVVMVFEWYASGLGNGRIVDRLRREQLPAPRGGAWQQGAVKRVLSNEKYLGKLIWNQKTFDRVPGSSRTVARALPRSQWLIQEHPELRIVSDELWARVAARRATIRKALPPGRALMRGRNAALFSRHLFSGFMTCAVCGKAVTTVTGGKGSPRYGCPNAWRHGPTACANRLTIQAKVADAHLLASLQAQLLAPATLRYISDALTSALNRRVDERPALEAKARAARDDAARRLRRSLAAIEDGISPASVRSQIAEREADIVRLDAELEALAKSARRPIAVIRSWIESQLRDVVSLLNDSPERAKTEFQRLGLAVTMQPVSSEAPRPFYRAFVEAALPWLEGARDLPGAAPRALDRLPSADLRQTFARNLEQSVKGAAVDRLHLRAAR